MNDILCGYQGDREATLMAYLYDELPSDERAAFDRHVTTCARCRVELSGLGDVRAQLARWAPPEPSFAVVSRQSSVISQPSSVSVASQQSPVLRGDLQPSAMSHQPWWRQIPVWAQVAAAMLVLGVSAGIANLDVHYDARNGLSVRTGWSKSAGAVASPASTPNSGASKDTASTLTSLTSASDAPWRAELIALREQLRSEMHSTASSTPIAARSGAPANDVEIVRRVKALIDESERRQQTELALRVAEVLRDVSARRDADLRKIDQNLGLMLDRTGVEVMKNRQMIDFYLQRVSQRP